MTRARNFADVISGNFAIPSGSLGNAVPADGSITTAKLADDAITSAKIADDAVTSAAIATNAVASDALNIARSDLPSGTVLQCVTTNYPDDFQFTLSGGATGSNGKMEVATGLNCSITPTSTNSKILYQATVYLGATLFYDLGMHIIRNATSTTAATSHTDTSPCGGSYLTDASGNAIRGQTSNNTPRGTGVFNNYNTTVTANYEIYPVSMSLLDHPNTTSQITYNFAIAFYNWESQSIYLNRSYGNQQGTTYDTGPVSVVTLMEIA
tara:strand:+ start:709 stop:1509 length:801 start_codon:yes stop_codon:yes gene_type:complete